MIEVQNLVKFYGDRQILHDLNFSIGSGRVCGLLGPNGSGKSTTMDILAGLLGQSSGSVRVCGFDVVTNTSHVKKSVGYLPDNPPLYKEMTVFDFVSYAAKLRGFKSPYLRNAVNSILEECDVVDVKDRVIGNLSKGYRQRVALSSALVHKPQVLILDEPTEGLDPAQIVLIRNLIKKLAKERTVILSSHILSEVQATCDEVIIIDKGKIKSTFIFDREEDAQKSYLFKFSSRLEEALNWFKQKNYVDTVNMTQNPNELLVKFIRDFSPNSQKEALAGVAKDVILSNFPLVGLQEKKDGLEERFFEVIKSGQSNLTIN